MKQSTSPKLGYSDLIVTRVHHSPMIGDIKAATCKQERFRAGSTLRPIRNDTSIAVSPTRPLLRFFFFFLSKIRSTLVFTYTAALWRSAERLSIVEFISFRISRVYRYCPPLSLAGYSVSLALTPASAPPSFFPLSFSPSQMLRFSPERPLIQPLSPIPLFIPNHREPGRSLIPILFPTPPWLYR